MTGQYVGRPPLAAYAPRHRILVVMGNGASLVSTYVSVGLSPV
jgi:hypothetical protein